MLSAYTAVLSSPGFVFVEEEPESIMIGHAQRLAVEVPLPDGVTLRQVRDESNVRAMSAMQDEVFGRPVGEDMANALLRRRADGAFMKLLERRILCGPNLYAQFPCLLNRSLPRARPRRCCRSPASP